MAEGGEHSLKRCEHGIEIPGLNYIFLRAIAQWQGQPLFHVLEGY